MGPKTIYSMIFQKCIGPDMFSWIRRYAAEVCAPPSALLVLLSSGLRVIRDLWDNDAVGWFSAWHIAAIVGIQSVSCFSTLLGGYSCLEKNWDFTLLIMALIPSSTPSLSLLQITSVTFKETGSVFLSTF